MSVMVPPASSTRSEPAATSHAESWNSKKPSNKPTGGVGEIERRGARAADGLAAEEDIFEDRQIGVEKTVGLERKAGRDQRALESGAMADPARAAVPPSAAAPRRRKDVVLAGIENHPELNPALHRHPDRHGELRDPVDEIRGAVERIDDPGGRGLVALE